MGRCKTLCLLPFALMLAAVGALAQVAVPDLTPGAPRFIQYDVQGFNGATVTPDNPAALQWGGPSRIVVGAIQHDEEPVGLPVQSFDGSYGGLRWVTEYFALGLEKIDVSHEMLPVEESASSGQLSFRVLDWLSLGAGVENSESVNGPTSSDMEHETYGASLRIAEIFYLGYGVSQDTLEDNTGFVDERDSTLMGVGVRTAGDWRWYLAWDKIERDDYPLLGGAGVDAELVTGQVGAGNWLLGAQQQTVKSPNPLLKIELTSTVVDIGWAPPESGLTITARVADGEFRFNNLLIHTMSQQSITIGYLF